MTDEQSLPQDAQTFETAMAELKEIVEQLETGDLTLKEMIDLFERGQALAVLCGRLLDEAALRLEELRADASGGYNTIPLDEPPD
jgi:exodeoxyribonuclease VII small subunit